MDTFDGTRLWVGRHGVDGDVLVFDPSRIGGMGDKYPFFSIAQKRERVFPISVVREKIVAVDPREATEILETYQVKVAEAALEKEERLSAEVERRHKSFLETRRLKYEGIRKAKTQRKHRAAHCYNCKHDLDNVTHPECIGCGWIICWCGACGCGYAGAARPSRVE